MHLSTLAVRRPVATTMLVLSAVLLGLVSLPRLEVTLLPESRSSTLLVWVPFDGAAVPEVEEAVARPVEETSLGVPGVRSVRTRVVSGGASFHVVLHPDIDPDLAALSLRERLDGVRWSFPRGVGRPLVLGGAGEGAPAMVLALAAEDTAAAADWSESVLRARLEQVDGIARAEILGAPRPEIRVTPRAERMRSLGIGEAEIAQALRDANVEAPGGTVRRRGVRYALAMETRLRSAEDVADVVLRPGEDPPLRVRDVADVTEGFEEAEGFVRLDDREAVGILVHRRSGANQLRLADGVREQLDRLAGEFPELSLAVVADSSPFVRQAVDGVWQAMWLGGLLAFGVLFLFLRDARSPLFLIAALPVSGVVTFAALERLGTSLNLMSLGGIALGMGMLVDNGIVCLENVHRLRVRGLPVDVAAARGAREIALPILASTLTTCAVFVPLAFVPGTVGVLFRDQAIAVGVSLLASWLAALTLLPMLVARFPGPVDGAVRRPWFGLYHRALEAGLRRPGRLLGFTAAGVAAALALLSVAPRELLPEVATDHLEISVETPPGTDVTATDDGARRVEAWLHARDVVSSVFTTVGDVGSLDPADPARRANRATVRARLADPDPTRRAELVAALARDFDADPSMTLQVVPDAPELATLLDGGQPALTADVRGPDDETAQRVARELTDRGGLDGVTLLASRREPRLRLRPRHDALWRLGLTEDDVVPAIESLGSGHEATRLRRFDEEIPVRLRRDGREESPAARDVVVRGRALPVADLFESRVELAPAVRWREDRARLASIRWDGPLREAPAARAALEAAAAAGPGLPPGYSLTFGGAYREMQETGRALVRAFLLSTGLVLLVLAAQFESVRLPVLIFAAVPLAMPGVALALVPAGGSVNVLSGIGLVVLIGIVVNDAILKVDLLRRFRAEGRSRRDAILAASRRRYRPIVMTTLTTTIGLLPLFLGRGAELRAPLAATLIGGLLSATVLTLLVIPALFERIAGRFEPASPPAAVPEPQADAP